MIDPRAIIDPSAEIASDVSVGPFSIIGPRVQIDSGTVIGPHVVIKGPTRIGKHNKIYQFASVGEEPQVAGFQDENTSLEIGDHNIIREYCTLHRGTPGKVGVTRIGDHNFFMGYTHVAHDCTIGNHIIFANCAQIAGFVQVGDYATLGAFAGVHQFCRIGAYSFLGRATKVVQDILPYLMVIGNPGGPSGLNLVGLKRRGFTNQQLRNIRHAYRLLFDGQLLLEEASEQIIELGKTAPELQIFIEGIQNSKRGIARKITTEDNSLLA